MTRLEPQAGTGQRAGARLARAVYVRGIAEAAAAVAAGRLDPEPLYTHRFKLEQIDEAFAAAAERPDGFVKAIVMMENA